MPLKWEEIDPATDEQIEVIKEKVHVLLNLKRRTTKRAWLAFLLRRIESDRAIIMAQAAEIERLKADITEEIIGRRPYV